MAAMRQRATSEDGFGVIELLIAMLVMSLGIMAIVAGFSSG
jgi:Tfp pilus assembly protein PilV